MDAMATAFEARNVSKSFGVVHALRGVSVSIRPGEVHAIIGENGAGKSTLMNIICGRLRPTAGELLVGGAAVQFHSPGEAQGAGIAIAPQEINLVPALTVTENIMLGAEITRGPAIDWRATREEALTHLHAVDDTIAGDARAGELSKAQQQLVQIARAVATKARILIFDEPTAALTTRETEKLYAFIRRFRETGGSAFYISHRLDEILDLSDRISVLRDGTYVGELDPKRTSKHEMVALMAGREVALSTHAPRRLEDRPVVLKVSGLSRPGEFEDVSFELHEGEVLGVSGLVGAGRTEVAKCIFGLTRAKAGSVEIFGDARPVTDPADAIQRGLVYLPEERKQEGIFPLLSIAENLTIATLDRFRGPAWMDFRGMARTVDDYVDRLRIKIGSASDPITSLSGGNQQKVILGRWLAKNAKILILDEPTRGIDVAAKSEIQGVLDSLTAAGLSIVYISSELEEVLNVSDRILVMHEGRVKGTPRTEDMTQESLLRLAMS
ncbi:sugar ABC transporter ATP-binding protein [Aureimonas phyllosphaerae]|uniref:ABC-type sugar transport system ATPase subunit n=1 Tax=Aureimonas phyllosphaerae TaxID=1166078 RepID=A0A7W6FU10_9HYPH|nr:sugar ABC transporter ATP-binding protein [Aureimonas phyllosphaerae]MBB3935744.1 ABC-type sugar transport system ATPase subunit [Aureimonas phyllosphaerae]MBB3959752.1 ABC-type sugar transport system ATPase subunit [Aureimonas phyllosphaerae]SFF14593.1 cellooligosaccharide ABC transporter ATP-binding protein [Aureimonas phyllosphaerae]